MASGFAVHPLSVSLCNIFKMLYGLGLHWNPKEVVHPWSSHEKRVSHVILLGWLRSNVDVEMFVPCQGFVSVKPHHMCYLHALLVGIHIQCLGTVQAEGKKNNDRISHAQREWWPVLTSTRACRANVMSASRGGLSHACALLVGSCQVMCKFCMALITFCTTCCWALRFLSHSRQASSSSMMCAVMPSSCAVGYMPSSHVMQPLSRRLPSVNMGAFPAFNPWDADPKRSFSIVWHNSVVCPGSFGAKHVEMAFWAWMQSKAAPPCGWQHVILCQYEMIVPALAITTAANVHMMWMKDWEVMFFHSHIIMSISACPCIGTDVWSFDKHKSFFHVWWKLGGTLAKFKTETFFSCLSNLLPTRSMCVSFHPSCLVMRVQCFSIICLCWTCVLCKGN